MCYSVSAKSSPIDLKEKYHAPYLREGEHLPFNLISGFAHPLLPVLSIDNGRSLNLYSWGLIPFWVKNWADGKKLSNQTLNAKSETIFEKPAFRDSITKRRCIIPVTGFFEYKHLEKDKQPYLIYPKEGMFFNLAGIYSYWTNPETKDTIGTFSIITGAANELMADIHNSAKRMPIIIDDRNIDAWIDNGLPKSSIIDLMQPQDDRAMAAHKVHRDIIKLGDVETVLDKI